MLEYKLAACDRVYDRDHDRILSPGWLAGIAAYTDCTFRVSVQTNSSQGPHYVSVYFRSLRFSSSANCSTSYLEVRDGDSLSSP